MHLCTLKKCPPLEHGIEQSKLARWLIEKARLTAELAKQVIEPFAEPRVEYTHNSTTWNEAARWAHKRRKSHSITTTKVVVPYPKQVLTLRNWLTEKSTQPDDGIIVDKPASVATELKPRPVTLVNNTAVLLYDDKDDIEFLT